MDKNMEKELDRRIQPEDFPKNYQHIAHTIGVELALTLVKNGGGFNQYIPLYREVSLNARNRLIKEEFDGNNYRALALKYNMSEAWVRTLVDRDNRRKQNEEMQKNQTSLFG